MSNCLITELKKLKISSAEAVENIGNFSDFKNYMHIKRKVQDELWKLIEKSSNSNKGKLILVCGSVGDGKSHILSYFNEKKPEVMRNFKICNDASESLDPEKTSIQTLNEILKDFSDENINYKNEKIIIAINLGTLTNFIDSEYGNKFTKLKEYVYEKKILEQEISNNEYEEESNFEYINFSDYHLYSLTEEGVKSDFITELFNKITDEKENNPFMKSYNENCTRCVNEFKCPIKENFKLLGNAKIKNNITSKLIEITIKYKIIISTRALLNFVYDILVSTNINDTTNEKLFNSVRKLDEVKYIESLLPMNLYSGREGSKILENLKKIDPLSYRSEFMDELIIKLENTERIKETLMNNLELNEKSYLIEFICKNVEENKIKSKLDLVIKAIIEFLLRANELCAISKEKVKDEIYRNFIKSLYYYNTNNQKINSLLKLTKKAAFMWYGDNEPNKQSDNPKFLNIRLGNNKCSYRIYQEAHIKPNLLKEQIQDLELYKFVERMNLSYTNLDSNLLINLDVDYELYDLIIRIINGYRPNREDRKNYVNFSQFIHKIEREVANKNIIYFEEIKEKNNNNIRTFILEADEYGDYSFRENTGNVL